MRYSSSIVTTDWLNCRLDDSSVRIVDASWHMPNAKREPDVDFKRERVTGARFFDLEAIADTSSQYPHMLPSAAAFAATCDALDISNETHVVLYDTTGMFSAPRVWWMFRAFGHPRVSVLNGGFPAWSAEGRPILRGDPTDEDLISAPGKAAQNLPKTTKYCAKLNEELVRSAKQVEANISSQDSVVIDARSPGRFTGELPEPREGIPSGHIPGSRNIPFADVLTVDGRYREPAELQKVFEDAGVDTEKPLVFTCGTGVTACVVALAAEQLKRPPAVSIYDGSWMEWGADESLPRATGPA